MITLARYVHTTNCPLYRCITSNANSLFQCNSKITKYFKNGDIKSAICIFNEMPFKNVVTWNCMISGYIRNGRIHDARELFDKMPGRNIVSWTAMLSGYARCGRLDEARALFDSISNKNVVCWNSMVSRYLRNGRIMEAREMFDAAPLKNSASWIVMIEGYFYHGLEAEAERLFDQCPALKFISCKDSSLRNIGIINSPQTHVLVQSCNGFKVDKVMIQSPGNTPNTDGIHIHSSHSLKITNSKIGSGDDCVSIGDYTSDIHISNIECGPGHGISIGSLGNGGNFVQVENIHVTDCSFKGTTNGARIKTWQVGRGYVRNIIFENLKFDAVKNPMIIDQNYCSVSGACQELSTGVKISNVIYKRFSGTSATDIAINLNCSRSIPCAAITMEAINLTSAKAGKRISATCVNVRGKETNVVPEPCLKNQV